VDDSKAIPPRVGQQHADFTSDLPFRLLVDSVRDYAIFLLDPEGHVLTWNAGAQSIKGYAKEEILGKHFSIFYLPEAKQSEWPKRELTLAVKEGRFQDEGWRVKKDGSTFWASVTITALRQADGRLYGFAKVTQDLTVRRQAEQRIHELNKELRTRVAELDQSQRVVELHTLELQKLSSQLLQSQDDERRRIARELHDDLARLETLVDEYALAADLDPKRAAVIAEDILSLARAQRLDADVNVTRETPTHEALRALDAHLCDLKEMQIRDGLHVFGQAPRQTQRDDLMVSIARLPRSDIRPRDASLHRALALDLGLGEFDPLTRDLADAFNGPRPVILSGVSDAAWRSSGDTVERIELLALRLVSGARPCDAGWERTKAVLDWIDAKLRPAIDACGDAEMAALLRGLDGRFVRPGPSGAPTRGRPDVLPTGRNFFAVDVRAVPTPSAWRIGSLAAERLVESYWQEAGEWPRAIALSAWGTANMRTGGDDVAQALALIGARPVWEETSGRVTGFAITPLGELKRPRVDVTFRVSGLFRDAFPTQMDIIGSAVRAIAELDEPDEANPIAANVRAKRRALEAGGVSFEAAQRQAAHRVFGSKPGAYGAGLGALIDEGGWDDRGDLAGIYLDWGGYAYGGGAQGEAARDDFAERLATIDLVAQSQDNREHDVLDSDDYYQFMGGLAATVQSLRGKAPRIAHVDTSRPEAPLARPLSHEISRVVRGRAANPKWIAGVMRHGYKGAFEIAATVDYLFGFAASTNAVSNHHFDQLFAAYLEDERVRDFMAAANPAALRETAARFAEAIRRGLWTPRSNRAAHLIDELLPKAQKEIA